MPRDHREDGNIVGMERLSTATIFGLMLALAWVSGCEGNIIALHGASLSLRDGYGRRRAIRPSIFADESVRVGQDLVAGRDGRFGIGNIHHAAVNERLGLLAPLIVEAQIPDRHEALHARLVYLFERGVAILLIAHPIGKDVVRVLSIIFQIFLRLRRCRTPRSFCP